MERQGGIEEDRETCSATGIQRERDTETQIYGDSVRHRNRETVRQKTGRQRDKEKKRHRDTEVEQQRERERLRERLRDRETVRQG